MLYFKKFFALLALIGLSMGANASTVHGSIGNLQVFAIGDTNTLAVSETFVAGAVDDVFLFSVITNGLTAGTGASATSTELSFGSANIFNIDNFKFALTNSTGSLLTAIVAAGESVSINPIADGIYGILFQGTATGTNGGFVNGGVVLSAVPVPAAAWLFGSALIGMVGVSRSRKATV
jgi:hypothetical protein